MSAYNRHNKIIKLGDEELDGDELRLKPDLSIKFPDKSRLYRTEEPEVAPIVAEEKSSVFRLSMMFVRAATAAAAIIILCIGLYSLWNETSSETTVADAAPKKENVAPVQPEVGGKTSDQNVTLEYTESTQTAPSDTETRNLKAISPEAKTSVTIASQPANSPKELPSTVKEKEPKVQPLAPLQEDPLEMDRNDFAQKPSGIAITRPLAINYTDPGASSDPKSGTSTGQEPASASAQPPEHNTTHAASPHPSEGHATAKLVDYVPRDGSKLFRLIHKIDDIFTIERKREDNREYLAFTISTEKIFISQKVKTLF